MIIIPITSSMLDYELMSVRNFRVALQEFERDVDEHAPQMSDTFSLGESIIDDDKVPEDKREEINGELNLLVNRWDRIKDFAALQKNR